MVLQVLTGKVLFVLVCLGLAMPLTGQEDRRDVGRLEASLDQIYGSDKLAALNTLTAYYTYRDYRKAIRYARQAVDLAERMFRPGGQNPSEEELELTGNAYLQLARLQFDKGTYFEARRNFQEVALRAERIAHQEWADIANRYITRIDSMVSDGSIRENFFARNLGGLNLSKVVTGAVESATIETEILQAQANEKQGAFQEAIGHYSAAQGLLENAGDLKRVNALHLKIAALYDSLGQHQQASAIISAALEKAEGDLPRQPAAATQDPEDPVGASDTDANAGPSALVQEKQNLKAIADKLAENREYEKSLGYYKLYQELSERMYEDSLRAVVESEDRDREILMLSQQKQIADLNLKTIEADRQKQVRLRNNLIYLSVFILLAGIVVGYFYFSKRREHGRLLKAYDELDQTKTRLETAEQRIVRLLAQQVSGDIANELIANDSTVLGERRFVCIMFLDIRDFTERAESMTPEELILYQNNIFSMMIDTVQKHHGIINQLLGDGFMATFGAPVSHGNDCQNAFDAAKEVLRDLHEKIEDHKIPQTRIGIGLHAGYVVTGNVGSEKRKQYSITGNAVIVASRVEQLNKTYKSQLIITEDVYNHLEKPLALDQPFLEVTVKGRTQPVKILKIA